MIQSVKGRGRSLQRTLEPRRKRIHSGKRSGSRKSKHYEHLYQKIYAGSSKPVKTASMLFMMMASPFFIIFLQVPLPPVDALFPSTLLLLPTSFNPLFPRLPLLLSQSLQYSVMQSDCRAQCVFCISKMSGSQMISYHGFFIL